MSAVRGTPEASIVQAARAVAEGRAQALVCAGGTGAALAAGLFNIKRARGIYRPALAIPLPVPGHPVTLLDVGANAEARREHLVQFAFMGAALARTVLGVERPRVGLLSNGEEAARGSRLIVETGEELAEKAARGEALEFVGNVEGGDVVGGRGGRDRDRRADGEHRAEVDGGGLADAARRGPGRGDGLDAGEAGRRAAAARAARGARRARPGGAGRRLPAGAAEPGGGAARALHAEGLRAGDPARAARRARRTSSAGPSSRSKRRGRCESGGAPVSASSASLPQAR